MSESVKMIVGKTIKKAAVCLDPDGGPNGACVELEFTDGTTFGLLIGVGMTVEARGHLFRDAEDDNPKILRVS